jgi:hypothetical protein
MGEDGICATALRDLADTPGALALWLASRVVGRGKKIFAQISSEIGK